MAVWPIRNVIVQKKDDTGNTVAVGALVASGDLTLMQYIDIEKKGSLDEAGRRSIEQKWKNGEASGQLNGLTWQEESNSQ